MTTMPGNKSNLMDDAMSAVKSGGEETAAVASEEDLLRKQLRKETQTLDRREPLDPTYKKLVISRALTHRTPVLTKDRFYKRIGSRMRLKVERYLQEIQGKDPFDRISQRQPLDEESMRSAFTLREAKDHEQLPLLEATLANQAMHPERKRHLDGMALALQKGNENKKLKTKGSSHSAADKAADARRRAEVEAQRAQARLWEETKTRKEKMERQRREEERYMAMRQTSDSPQQTLHKIIEPVFKKLWNMEFPMLNNTNPFRVIIDRDNCASIGAPDYFSIITIPMNLTYIKRKIDSEQYTTLQQFFGDVELMLANAVKYNAHPDNPYRKAAEDMKKRHDKIVKRVWEQIHQRQQTQQQQAAASP